MNHRSCDCFQAYYLREEELDSDISDEAYDRLEAKPVLWKESSFHRDENAETTIASERVQQVIDDARSKKLTTLVLSKVMDEDDYLALNTLPKSIGDLKDLQHLDLSNSKLSYIPREIEGCVNLQKIDIYHSYRLHWFPIEILNCSNLRDTTVSPRALYGNYKLRSPFPNLRHGRWNWSSGVDRCAVCRTEQPEMEQYWMTRRVGSDDLPLLMSICGQDCLLKIKAPKDRRYIQHAHQGGLIQRQPSLEL